jgi:hypothetical protein
MEAEHSMPPRSLHHLLREIFFKYVNQIKRHIDIKITLLLLLYTETWALSSLGLIAVSLYRHVRFFILHSLSADYYH